MNTEKKIRTTTKLVLALALLLPAGLIQAATPPGLVNFEGVLRDASGVPETGTKEMEFVFYDSDGGTGCPLQGGTVLLADSHLFGGSGGVTITDGLFNVELGGGVITAVSESSLSEVFRDNSDVYLEVVVDSEVLCPRIHMISAAYSLNADHLDGVDSSGYINTSAAAQTKAGDLTLGGDLTVSGSNLRLGDNAALFENYIFLDDSASPGVGPYISSVGGATLILAGDNDSDDLLLCGGAGCGDGGIQILGNSETQFIAGNGRFSFSNGAPGVFDTIAELSPAGDLQIDGDLTVSGNDISFGDGAVFSDLGPSYWLRNNADTDDMFLYAGNSEDDGGLSVFGDGEFHLISGNGLFQFRNGATGFQTAFLEPGGDLQIAGQSFVLNKDGPEGDQNIDFYDNGIPRNERFQWDDPADRFEFSDDLHVFGTLTANVKSFVQNHPYRPDLEVVYVSLEGDESTTFTRGFGRLRDGVARVALGESFAFVTNPDIGVSAHVTPRGTWADLYVESVTPEELVVRSRDGENPDGVFDYIVFGLRIGFEEFPVFRQKRAEAFIPPQGYYEEEYQRDPALRDYNALERYGRMAARVHGTRTLDLEASRRLREAIGEHDPTFDFPPGSTVSVAEMNQMRARDEQVGLTLDEREIDRLVDRPEPVEVETAAVATTAPPSRIFRDEQQNSYASSFRPSAPALASLAPGAEPVEAGDVLIIDPEQTGMMSLAREAGDTAVFGVVAATPDAERTVEESGTVEVSVAVSGVVLVKVDAGYGSIRPGDLLTTSPTMGHAMRADAPQIGTVLGKALEPLDVGTGLIKVLVMLR